jgi:hypothetical protein
MPLSCCLLKWSFKMNVVNYHMRIFLHRHFSQFKSVNYFRIYTCSSIFLSGRKETLFYVSSSLYFLRSVSHSRQVMEKYTTLSNPLRLTLRKGIKILLKLRTTLFNHRPKSFRQRSSNKTQLNMNSSKRIHMDSPRELGTTLPFVVL